MVSVLLDQVWRIRFGIALEREQDVPRNASKPEISHPTISLYVQLPSTRSLLLTPYPPFPSSSSPKPAHTESSSPSSSDPISPEPEPLLSKLTPHTSHPDPIRRGGCLGAIKNIALDRGCHAFLLASEGDRVRLGLTGATVAISSQGEEATVRGVDVLPAVLGPLMGGEEYDMEVSNSFGLEAG